MRRIRFKVVSIVVCISLLASLSLGFVPYENIKYEEAIENKLKEEFKNYLKNNQDANEYIENDTKKIIDNNENVTIMVMLKADSAIDDAKDKDEAILLEKNIKEEQKKIIAKVEKITATKVEQSFGYLVNGFSIQGKYSDIDKIKKVDGVKEAYASQKYKTSRLDIFMIIVILIIFGVMFVKDLYIYKGNVTHVAIDSAVHYRAAKHYSENLELSEN